MLQTKATQANNNDLQAIRDLIKRLVIRWTKDGYTNSEIAKEYADLHCDFLYILMLNEEISYKFDAIMKLLPSEQDLETLIVMHTKMMKAETDNEKAEQEKQTVENLHVLLEAKQKFNKD